MIEKESFSLPSQTKNKPPGFFALAKESVPIMTEKE
jgi:hypothetical protein